MFVYADLMQPVVTAEQISAEAVTYIKDLGAATFEVVDGLATQLPSRAKLPAGAIFHVELFSDPIHIGPQICASEVLSATINYSQDRKFSAAHIDPVQKSYRYVGVHKTCKYTSAIRTMYSRGSGFLVPPSEGVFTSDSDHSAQKIGDLPHKMRLVVNKSPNDSLFKCTSPNQECRSAKKAINDLDPSQITRVEAISCRSLGYSEAKDDVSSCYIVEFSRTWTAYVREVGEDITFQLEFKWPIQI